MCGAAVLALSMTGCSDPETTKDLVLDRVLSPLGLSTIASNLDPDIYLSWEHVSNAESYVVQAFTEDPEANPSAIPTVEKDVLAIVDENDGKSVRDTLRDLAPLTQYYIRVKGISSQTADSKWVVKACSTKDEQILLSHPGFITKTSVKLYWPSAKKFDKIVVLDEAGAKVKEQTVADYTKSTIVVDGLEAGNTYTFQAFNGTIRRGNLVVPTVDGIPAGDYEVTLSAASTAKTFDMSFQKLMNDVAAEAAAAGKSSYTYVVTIAAGQEVLLNNVKEEDNSDLAIEIPEGMSLIVAGEGDGSAVKFTKEVNVKGTHDKIAFQSLTVNAGSYFLNQSAACDVNEISFSYCEMPACGGNTWFRTQGSNKPKVANIKLKYCNLWGVGGTYYLFDLRKNEAIYNVVVDGCTLADMSGGKKVKGLLQGDTPAGNLTFTNTTFYGLASGTNTFINTTKAVASMSFENCLFGNCFSTAKVYDASKFTVGMASFAGTFYTKDVALQFAEDQGENCELSTDEVFVDAAGQNMTLNPAATKVANAGDSRKRPEPYI